MKGIYPVLLLFAVFMLLSGCVEETPEVTTSTTLIAGTQTTTSTTTLTTTSTTTSTTSTSSSTSTTSTTISEDCYNGRQDEGEDEVDCGGPCMSCYTGYGEFRNMSLLVWNTALAEEEIVSCKADRFIETVVVAANNRSSLSKKGHLYLYNRKKNLLEDTWIGTNQIIEAVISEDGIVIYALIDDVKSRKLYEFDKRLRGELIESNISSGDIEITPDGKNFSHSWDILSYNGRSGLNAYGRLDGSYLLGAFNMSFEDEVSLVAASPYLDYVFVATTTSLFGKKQQDMLFLVRHELSTGYADIRWEKELDSKVTALSLSENAEYLAAGLEDGSILLYNRKGEELMDYKANWSIVSVDLTADGDFVLAASRDRYIYVINKSGSLLWKYKTGEQISAGISPDGMYIFACSKTVSTKLQHTHAVVGDSTSYVESRAYVFKGPAASGIYPEIKNCGDDVLNYGELDVDCGGPCELCPRIECFSDTDCGVDGYVGDYRCDSEDNAVMDYYEYECHWPGEPASVCSTTVTGEVIGLCF